jgi:diaminohydroxyphosphoribosylaminopyrimidine deaminase/5-amino-6-(5-phosphoribosylamino)uracil reductase
MPATDQQVSLAMRRALNAARAFAGATSPNPPVGSAALDETGGIVSIFAHERAGEGHAEARVIQDCLKRGFAPETLVITLEPCNHTGRTPPCTDAILELAKRGSLKRVVYGSDDPNPRVRGSGLGRLRAAGLAVDRVADPELRRQCDRLVAPFVKWITLGRPWVTLKSALNRQGSMLPEPGTKTFTSPDSLRLAHELRRRADAILTGSGTVLADLPEFTVRHVADIPGKRRWLIVLDRRGRTPEDWLKASETRGFRVRTDLPGLEEALNFLGSQGVLEVLVEAGPAITQSVLSASLWDEHVVITQAKKEGDQDTVEAKLRVPI